VVVRRGARTLPAALEHLKNGLIVSCQAHGDHPLRDTTIIGALAECAERGGTAGIRADGPEDVAEIKRRVSLHR
jgi:N-acylglucosamine-6-phosphate 2-epimerase